VAEQEPEELALLERVVPARLEPESAAAEQEMQAGRSVGKVGKRFQVERALLHPAGRGKQFFQEHRRQLDLLAG